MPSAKPDTEMIGPPDDSSTCSAEWCESPSSPRYLQFHHEVGTVSRPVRLHGERPSLQCSPGVQQAEQAGVEQRGLRIGSTDWLNVQNGRRRRRNEAC